MFQLVSMSENRVWPITGEAVVIGRGEVCNIRVPDPLVSRVHCKIWCKGDVVQLQDLDSSNATLLNGEPVHRTALRAGDKIAVGDSIFKIALAEAQETTPEDRASDDTATISISQLLSESMALSESTTGPVPKSVQEFRDLFVLHRSLSIADQVPGLLERFGRSLAQHFAPDQACLLRKLSQNRKLVSYNLCGSAAPLEYTEAIVERVFKGGESFVRPRMQRENGRRRLETTMFVPLLIGGNVQGLAAVCSHSRRRVYDIADLEWLALMAQVLAPFLFAVERHDQRQQQEDRPATSAGIVGKSPVLREALQLAEVAADTRLSVLLTGETGTGKELFARYIHSQSARAGGPFVALNCSALPAALFESEMFGHEPGAFTGAGKRRAGHIEEAHGGTLFLDEIGDLPLEQQSALLRTVETGTFFRVGGRSELTVDVRILCATNLDLQEAVEQGAFRRDLYHRLAGFEIHLPPLRERPEDIDDIAAAFLHEDCPADETAPVQLAPEALAKLQTWRWPGNVRELKLCIERAAALARGQAIQAEHIILRDSRPASPTPPSLQVSGTLPLAEIESAHIQKVVEAHSGNMRAAARALGISRATLYRKIGQGGAEGTENES